jgi:hypothetical protein
VQHLQAPPAAVGFLSGLLIAAGLAERLDVGLVVCATFSQWHDVIANELAWSAAWWPEELAAGSAVPFPEPEGHALIL